MAMQKLLFAEEYYPTNANIERILTEGTTVDSYNVHEGGLINNQLIADKRTLEHLNYHNSYISQNNQISSKSISNPRVSSTYHPISGQRALSYGDIQGKEVANDHLIRTIPTRNSLFNDDYKDRISLMSSVAVVNQSAEGATRSRSFLDHPHQIQAESQEPFSFFSYEFPLKSSVGCVASPKFYVPFPETNDQQILPIAQLNPSRDLKVHEHENINQVKPLSRANKAPTVVNHPNTYGGWGHMDTINQESHIHKTHGTFVCFKCDVGFSTALCYEAHMQSHYEAEIMAQSVKAKESLYGESLWIGQSLEMPGKDQGISLSVDKGWNTNADIKTEATVKKEPIDYAFERTVGKKLYRRGVVIREEPYYQC